MVASFPLLLPLYEMIKDRYKMTSTPTVTRSVLCMRNNLHQAKYRILCVSSVFAVVEQRIVYTSYWVTIAR